MPPTPAASIFALMLATVPMQAAASPAASVAPAAWPRLDALRGTQARVDLPAGLPEHFTLTVETPDGPVELRLQRHDLRAPNFRVRVFADDGSVTTVPAPEPTTYRGIVVGQPNVVVGASLRPEGLVAEVIPPLGERWSILPLAAGAGSGDRSAHVIVRGGAAPAGLPPGSIDAGGIVPDGPLDPAAEAAPVARRKAAGATMKLAQIAFDVDFPYYQNLGSSVPDTVANVEAHLMAVDAHYARDVLITYELTDIIVRTASFYVPDPNNSLLILFRDEWRANQQAVVRDIAHLMTGQPAPGLAGLAYVSVTCSQDWAYGWSVDSSGVVSHELGHNWSSGHCHDTAPCNNMCGACLYIGPNTADIITSFRDTRTCLDDVGAYAIPTEPYAHPDAVTLERADADVRTPVVVDVLANDHDANCDPLTIVAFDTPTERGGVVDLSVGTGPNGRDELRYTPPCYLASGNDRFEYTIDDGTGLQATTWVDVNVLDVGEHAYWKLDGGAGIDAADATGWKRDGVTAGNPPWGTGRFGGALDFDGVDDHVVVPGLDLPSEEATITAWLQRNGDQNPWAGIVFTRSGAAAGLNFGNANELRYHWGIGAAAWGWDSGLVVPDAQWVFTALVVEAGSATLYLHDGTLQSAVNLAAHPRQPFAGETRLGMDPNDDARRFRGLLDDVRVYPRALSPAEIAELVDDGGPAVAPVPADGGFLGSPEDALSWSAGHQATSHDIYFGTDWQAIVDATRVSPEFQGNQAGTTWDPPGLLSADRTYYWRVDEHVGARVLRGETWLFTVRDTSAWLAGHWTLDDGAGTTVTDRAAGQHGDFRGAPGWDVGTHGGALVFDGDDSVSIPSVSATRVERTITTWIRRNGDQDAWAGLVFTRDAGSVAGFNFGQANELRYHWGIGAAAWNWDSTLVVPDNQWVFAALVIEPDQATIHLHDGAWSTAVNAVGHGLQSFDGETFIGLDPNGGPRWFRGWLDDVRIYEGALSSAELDLIRLEGGPAERPNPKPGTVTPTLTGDLTWVAGALATTHDVYFGGDHAAVRDATTASPEFQGNQATTAWTPPGPLLPGNTYYWRIDERNAAGVVAGRVWHFALTPVIGPTLRVFKTVVEEPELSWRELGYGAEYEVRRCVPVLGAGCAPAPLTVVGPRQTTHVDVTAAAEPLLWYQVERTGACGP